MGVFMGILPKAVETVLLLTKAGISCIIVKIIGECFPDTDKTQKGVVLCGNERF